MGLPFQFINRYTSNTVCTLTSVAAESVGNFKLKIYDETGTTVKKTIDINDDNTNEFFFYGNYNNDAVKIGVEGVGLVRMSLTIQALDPYIDHMEIVCEEAQLNTTTNLYEPTGNGRKLSKRLCCQWWSIPLLYTNIIPIAMSVLVQRTL